ncbi:hypothetical protein DPMN_169986 [Dreissena polymorpha]|uniref:Ig-like domain-containing protein n=1 Tax=Dreissena polymorpha TaxID=45954 RepID=A0A9D4ICS5_DREPO|nr:hypothetical protein DPMN_169986 [Dreissena polymorpha]
MLKRWKELSQFCTIGIIIFTLPFLVALQPECAECGRIDSNTLSDECHRQSVLQIHYHACIWGNDDDCPWPSCSKSCGGGSMCRTCESCWWTDEAYCEACNTFCFNGGSFQSGSCMCQPWRSGECCEECSSITIAHCLPGKQECGGSPDGVMCTQCENGYTSGGYGNGCIDIDECREGMAGCSHGCENTAGSFRCTCPHGYPLSDNGQTCIGIDECAPAMHGCSQVCTNHSGSIACSCYPGYRLQADQQSCTDIDECADVLNGGCDDLCINTVGSFQCACTGNSTINTDGFTCSGANMEASNFFSTNGLIHQLLPKGCHYIIMSTCDENSDNIILSSTSDWLELQSNNDVVFTFGITFVEIKTIVLPLSISGLQVNLKSMRIVSGSLQYSSADGIKTGDERAQNCWTFDITPKDIHDIVQSFAFTRTFFNNIQDILPSWLQFSHTEDVVISANILQTEIRTGAEINSGVCKGAPLIPSRFYNVFQLGHGFSINIYGQNLTIPRPFSNKIYCIITDICEDLVNTIFIILPEGSRDVLDELRIFKSLKQSMGVIIRPTGIGLSLDQRIQNNWETTEINFWRGDDELFAYPIKQSANIWIEGEASLIYGFLRAESSANAHVAVPNLEMILPSIFTGEWRVGVHFTATAALQFNFDFFGDNININLLPSNGDVMLYGSLGGIDNRSWCGPLANPPGLFLNAMISINAFRDIPLLSFIDIDLRVRAHAFILSDPTIRITALDTASIVDDLVQVINITETLVKNLNNVAVIYASRLTEGSVVYLKKLIQTAAEMMVVATDLLKDVRQRYLDESLLTHAANELGQIWHASSKTLEIDARVFLSSIVNNSSTLKQTISQICLNAINDIKSHYGKIIDNLLNPLGKMSKGNESFGLKFYGDLTLFGLQFPTLDLEFVYSTGTHLSHCDRYDFAQNFLKTEKAIRIFATLKRVVPIGRFLKADAGLGYAISLDQKGKFALILRGEASFLGCRARVDMYISQTGLEFFLEVKIWSAFKAQLDVSFKTDLDMMNHAIPVLQSVTLNIKGRFIADTDGDGDFSDSYLSALIRFIQHIADEAEARLSGLQEQFTSAQHDLTAASNWLEDKKAAVDSANSGFDNAVKALEVAKVKLEEAKAPFQKAIDALENAQRKVDRLCKIKECDQICVPGIKCSVCYTKVWFVRIPYPCCSLTGCMFSIPDPICVLANSGCRVLRGVAYAALEVAQLALRVPMLILDAAKAAVHVAQVVVDKSRVVLDIAKVALDMANIGLEGVKLVFVAAKLALEAVKAVVKLGVMALNFVLKYGLQTLIDVRNCRFEIELSTNDFPIFDVQCEVNAFRTGFIPVGIKINFNDPIQSLWNAAKGTIEMILNKIGNVFSGRKRREIRDKTLAGLYTSMRFARNADVDDSHFEMFANKALNETFNTYASSNISQSDEYAFRKQLFTDKCLVFTRIRVFFYDATTTLSDLVHETASTMNNMTSIKGSLQTINTHDMSSKLSYKTIGVDPIVAYNEFNISISELENTIDGERENISTDPLLVQIASFAEDASMFMEAEVAGANKIMIVNQWIAAMNNVTVEYFNNDTCVSFLDCAHYAIAVLYEQFAAVNVTNQTETLYSVSQFEDVLLLLVGNGSHTIEDVDLMTMALLETLKLITEHYVFCSKAPEMLAPLQNISVKTGSNVSLACNATGDPTPNFWWYKNSELILDENKMFFHIANVVGNDSASYHCKAGNLVANYSFEEAYVTVLDNNDLVTIEDVSGNIGDEQGVDLKVLILVPIGVLLTCATILSVLVWRYRIRRMARTKPGRETGFKNNTYGTTEPLQTTMPLQDRTGRKANRSNE